MTWLLNLFLTNVFVAGIAWLALRYGDAGGERFIDRLNWYLRFRLPVLMRRAVRLLIGSRGLRMAESAVNYVINERNPLTMFLYMLLSVGGYIGFVVSCYPHLPNDTLDFPYHKEVGFALFSLSLFFFSRSASVNPGLITKANHATVMRLYPFDGCVFKPNTICSTCKVDKPARSKHCRTCGIEIAKFDHHCIWINQCVGLGNQREFLLFLLFNNLMCLYGAYLGLGIMLDRIRAENLTEAWFRDANSGNRFKASPYYIVIYLMSRNPLGFYLTALCTIMGVFLLAFTWYHWVTLLRQGITTNEESKLKRVSAEERARFLALYSKGTWWKNLKDLLFNERCPPLTPGTRIHSQ